MATSVMNLLRLDQAQSQREAFETTKSCRGKPRKRGDFFEVVLVKSICICFSHGA